jgi:hypothetical protein
MRFGGLRLGLATEAVTALTQRPTAAPVPTPRHRPRLCSFAHAVEAETYAAAPVLLMRTYAIRTASLAALAPKAATGNTLAAGDIAEDTPAVANVAAVTIATATASVSVRTSTSISTPQPPRTTARSPPAAPRPGIKLVRCSIAGRPANVVIIRVTELRGRQYPHVRLPSMPETHAPGRSSCYPRPL